MEIGFCNSIGGYDNFCAKNKLKQMYLAVYDLETSAAIYRGS